jgi:hypothetical protein
MADGWSFKDAGAGEGPAPRDKRPLFRPLPPASAFPARALGPLRAAAEAIQARTQAPLQICAQSVLAAATLAAQPHRDVELPGTGRRPLTEIFATVADSGERKTSVDKIALAEVYRVEEEWREASRETVNRFKADLAGWKEAEASIRKRGKGDRGLIRDGLINLGPEPRPPPHPMLLIADPTPEALVLHLADGRPWAGVFTAEGGLLIGGAAFNEESRMRTGALLNALWDGEPIRRRRVLTGASFLPGRRCSAHVMMQPVVAERLFGDPMLDGIGLLARVLLVAPESTVGSRFFRDAPAECAVVLAEYRSRLGALLRSPPTTAPDDPGILMPDVMTLAPDARALWIRFSDHMERQAGPGGALAPVRAWAAKGAEHAGRIAAVLALHADPDAMEVSAEHMACGVGLATFYASEMMRLAGTAGINADLRLASKLRDWWQGRDTPRIHLATVYQRGLNAIGDAAKARLLMEILVEHGHAWKLRPGEVVDDVPRRDAWELIP